MNSDEKIAAFCLYFLMAYLFLLMGGICCKYLVFEYEPKPQKRSIRREDTADKLSLHQV